MKNKYMLEKEIQKDKRKIVVLPEDYINYIESKVSHDVENEKEP